MFKKQILDSVESIPKQINKLSTPEKKISATYYLLAILALAGVAYFMYSKFDNSDQIRLKEKDQTILDKTRENMQLRRSNDSLILKIFDMNIETINKLERLTDVQDEQKNQLRNIK